MRGFVIAIALASLVIPPLMADPAVTQTSAELEQSAPSAMDLQPAKAGAAEFGEAQMVR
jgi:hypothetical protein